MTQKPKETRAQREQRFVEKIRRRQAMIDAKAREDNFLRQHGYTPNRKGRRAFTKLNGISVTKMAMHNTAKAILDGPIQEGQDQELVQHEAASPESGGSSN